MTTDAIIATLGLRAGGMVAPHTFSIAVGHGIAEGHENKAVRLYEGPKNPHWLLALSICNGDLNDRCKVLKCLHTITL